jgi:zinc protease
MQILGGGRTSRLYRELVEKGLAVDVAAWSTESEAPGMVAVGASPSPNVSLARIEKATLEITDKFLKEGPTAQELARAKRSITAAEIFGRDNQMTMAGWYGSQLVAGRSLEWIEGWQGRVNAVTAEQALAAMKKYMTGVNHIDATLLPEGR